MNSPPAAVISATRRPARDTTIVRKPARARMRTSSTAPAPAAPTSRVGTTTSTAIESRALRTFRATTCDCTLGSGLGKGKLDMTSDGVQRRGIDFTSKLGNGCALPLRRSSCEKYVMNEPRLTSVTVGSDKDGRSIVVRERKGANPGLFWLGGFKSDMKGTKAEALDHWAASVGRACVRFDYSGHGESGGKFTEGTIGRWLEESLAVYLRFAQGPQVVIGSSMGGWLALLLARALCERKHTVPIVGMVLIAPAVDFTEELMWQQFSDAIKREIEKKGVWMRPSRYDEEPYPI